MYIKKLNKLFISTLKTHLRNNYICKRKNSQQTNAVLEKGPWNVLFFGSDEFAVESLKCLHEKCKQNVLQRLEVVTNVDRKHNAVTKYAMTNNIKLNKWPVEGVISNFHVGIVVSFGHLIPSNIIHSFPLGILNVHGSLLPKWRGAAPITYALMNGETKTGVTLMKIMPKRFDTGPIILQKEVNVSQDETLPELFTKLAKLGADILAEAFENLPQVIQSARPQDETEATYAPKITSKLALIDWNEMSAEDVYNLYRALMGLYPITTYLDNKIVRLFEIKKIVSPRDDLVEIFKDDEPGTGKFDRTSKLLVIKCKDGTFISVGQILIESGRRQDAKAFNNGYMGARKVSRVFFTTPNHMLQSSHNNKLRKEN